MKTHLLLWVLLAFSIGNAQQITLDTSLVSDEEGVIEEFWYWSGGFPVLGEGFAPNAEITVFATDPNGNPWRDFTGTSDGSGNFSVQISAKKIRSVLGDHTVTATDGSNTVAATLTVTANQNEVVDVSINPNLLSQADFNTSGIVISASGIEPNAEVKLHIFSPNESGSEIDSTNPKYADENGNFEYSINAFTPSYPWGPWMPEVPGKWRINIQDWSGNEHYGQTNFRIWPENPSVLNYCEITQVESPTGQNLVYPITSFEIDGVNIHNSSVESLEFYEDFTNTSFDLVAGNIYTVRLKGKNYSSFAADTYTLFIDWNQNGVLDEDNEVIHEGYIFNSTGEDGKFTEFQITIPENAVNGNTRLRILKMRSATTYSMYWPTGACGYYTGAGQVEDYTLNIAGGVTLPDCELTCPEDITVQAENDAESVVIDYDISFDCEQVNGICEVNYTGDSESFLPIANPIVANDFDIPAGASAQVTQITANIARAMFTSSANIYLYEDNMGQPGELIQNFPNVAYTSRTEAGTIGGYPIYECVWDLPSSVELESGKYWLGLNIGGPLIYWETTANVTTEIAYSTFNSGNTWEPNDENDGVFKVTYECMQDPSEMVELVLVEGLASGSEFPIGTTTVTHNLIYEDHIIDTCSFDVIVEPTASENCTITCPENITVVTEQGETTAVVEYEIGFECEEGEAQAELILTSGLPSGAEFPIGTTTVTYNLVYDGEILDTCSFDVTVEEYMSVNDLNNYSLSVYPNPVKDILNISYNKEISKVSVYDLSGEQVYTINLNSKNAKINLRQLPSGVYVIKAEISGETKTFKIMKK